MRTLPATLAVLLVAASGCTVGPDYKPPVARDPVTIDGASASIASSDPVETAWWHRLNDPVLDRLITLGSEQNHGLRLAEARLREARALWTAARFDYAPTVRSEGSYANTQASRATRPDDSRHRRHNELYRVGFDASWELDLWGRVRRDVEAARATVESVQADRDDVLIAVRAEIAFNYLELRGDQAHLEVARRNATNQTDTVQLAEALRDGGQGTQLDVARARSQLNTTLAAIPPLEASVDRAIHRIGVLCGQRPNALRPELESPAPLPSCPARIGVGDPTELLRRRPDVRAAERSLAAATARIGVEVADLFPRITFSGDVALEANRLSGLGDSGGEAWGFGPRISWAALDLGRVRQRIHAADARADAALAIYERSVLLALEETEDSFVTLGRERQRLAHLNEAEHAAKEAVELARQRYRDGVADFLSVLDSERTLLSLQEQLVTSETLAATHLIAVYKALGGGWETEESKTGTGSP